MYSSVIGHGIPCGHCTHGDHVGHCGPGGHVSPGGPGGPLGHAGHHAGPGGPLGPCGHIVQSIFSKFQLGDTHGSSHIPAHVFVHRVLPLCLTTLSCQYDDQLIQFHSF